MKKNAKFQFQWELAFDQFIKFEFLPARAPSAHQGAAKVARSPRPVRLVARWKNPDMLKSMDWFCWENLQETMVFTSTIKLVGLSCKFSHHPIL